VRLASAYNRSLIEASLDPLVTIDAGGKITDVNAATEKVTGRSRTAPSALIFPIISRSRKRRGQDTSGYLREGTVTDYPLEISTGRAYYPGPVQCRGVPRPTGKVIGFLPRPGTITELKESERRTHTTNELPQAVHAEVQSQ